MTARLVILAFLLVSLAPAVAQGPAFVAPPPPPAPAAPAVVVPAPPPALAPPPASAPGAAAPRVRREPLTLPVGELQTLEKITGRVRSVDVVVGEATRIGSLVITLRACRKRPQEEIPESAAFMEINEQRAGDEGPTRLFTGWMFATSPAMSALEHPGYDVWLVDCKTSAASISR